MGVGGLRKESEDEDRGGGVIKRVKAGGDTVFFAVDALVKSALGERAKDRGWKQGDSRRMCLV